MKRIGIIFGFCILFAANGWAVSRVGGVSGTVRQGTATQRVRTQSANNVRGTTGRTATNTRVAVRSGTTKNIVKTDAAPRGDATVGVRKTNTKNTVARAGTVSRAATSATTETRTGAEYEQCKSAFFACMDQFCQLKNDDYRRCSCSDRITSLQTARDKLQQAGEQLTAFNENLDIVGKTAAQAAAMNTATEGELALTSDKSKSKALLNAIMNSIRGADTRVENKYLVDLNSIDLSVDSSNYFGGESSGQIIASYNGVALYSAVFPQCRDTVRAQCNDASMQRAVNAYLMAIEQDCNTVQTAITKKQKETHAAIRESSSMLDMARAENHKNHNSDEIATCVANVEAAILAEDVCGSNYHKCLDNGEYIDVSTGAPIAGVADFYKLGEMLTFTVGRNNSEQKLAQISANMMFVSNFEKRVKQFAEPALDKCLDDADVVWADYLNKALLDIYYAQQDKVQEIRQGCFDFVSACYMNGDTAMTDAMSGLAASQKNILTPDVQVLDLKLCDDYIRSCNNMFTKDGINIVQEYVEHKKSTDSVLACRAVAKQCFDNYGGQNYENFYNPRSGLFESGNAPQWFALYDIKQENNTTKIKCNKYADEIARTFVYATDCAEYDGIAYVSECAKQLAGIDACSDKELIEQVFGGLDYYSDENISIYRRYDFADNKTIDLSRHLRPTGVASEIYSQIIDILQSKCSTINDGKFMTVQNLEFYQNDYNSDDFCVSKFTETNSQYHDLADVYGFVSGYENMCPMGYDNDVDVQSWGACSCWENGGRRSNNGTSTQCLPSFPVKTASYTDNGVQYTDIHARNASCTLRGNSGTFSLWTSKSSAPTANDWCTVKPDDTTNRVLPFDVRENKVCGTLGWRFVNANDIKKIDGISATNYVPDVCCFEPWDDVKLVYRETIDRKKICYYCAAKPSNNDQDNHADVDDFTGNGSGKTCYDSTYRDYTDAYINTWSTEYAKNPIDLSIVPCGNGGVCKKSSTN